MTKKLPRCVAEDCTEQIRLMYPGFRPENFGRPELHEENDYWTIHWPNGPYWFSDCIPQGMPPGVHPAADWPKGVRAVSVEKQVVALYADEVPRETSRGDDASA